MKGNFVVGRVEQLKMVLDETYLVKNEEMKKKKDCGAEASKDLWIYVLNKSDLKKFNLIKKKMEMLDKLK